VQFKRVYVVLGIGAPGSPLSMPLICRNKAIVSVDDLRVIHIELQKQQSLLPEHVLQYTNKLASVELSIVEVFVVTIMLDHRHIVSIVSSFILMTDS